MLPAVHYDLACGMSRSSRTIKPPLASLQGNTRRIGSTDPDARTRWELQCRI